jgi:hypothetical protein
MPVWFVFGVQSRARRTVPSGAAALGEVDADGRDDVAAREVGEALGDGPAGPGPHPAMAIATDNATVTIRFMRSDGFGWTSGRLQARLECENAASEGRGRRQTSRRACFLRRY